MMMHEPIERLQAEDVYIDLIPEPSEKEKAALDLLGWREKRFLGLNELRAANIERNGEWFEGKAVPLSFRAVELAGEVGEACNEIKKLERNRLGLAGGKSGLGGLEDELADVVISVDLIAMDLGINLSGAICAKFNATSEKHGMETRL